MRKAAITYRILTQAETEGKEYIESLLHAVNRSDIKVVFDKPVAETFKEEKSRENKKTSLHKPSLSKI